MSEITDQAVQKHANALSMQTVLDISNCLEITSEGIKVVGKSCKYLVRDMVYGDLFYDQDDSEAMAVANTIHKIEQLQLSTLDWMPFSYCRDLRMLDIHGCSSCKLEDETTNTF